jgi:hypothetical protein
MKANRKRNTVKKWIVLPCALALALPSAAAAGPPVREHPGADKDQPANHGDCKNPGPKGDWANEPGQPKTTGWHNGYDCGPATPPVVTPPPVKPPKPPTPPKTCPPPPPTCSCPTTPPASNTTTTTNVTNVTNVTVVRVVRVKAKPHRHHAKRHTKHHRKHHRRHAPRTHHRAPLFAG